MIKIRVFNPQAPSELQELELSPELSLNHECLIGRLPNSNLFLDRPEVSRMHGKIGYRDGQYYFVDLHSRLGSWVNSEAAKGEQEYPLNSGDIIKIGGFVLMVVDLQTSGAPMPPPSVSHEGDTVIGVADPILQPPPEPVVSPTPTPQPVAPVSEPAAATGAAAPEQYMPVAFVDPNQFPRWNKGDLDVRCIQIIDETADVKTFRFVAEPPVLFTYKPGQFANLNLEINGEEVLRSYSISSTPSRPHTLEFTVKRVAAPPNSDPSVPRGLVSNWLHDNIKVGSTINLSGPLGKFTCFNNPSSKLLFISAGSGITPMMSMSRWVQDTGADCDIVFLHSARSPQDIICRQELEMLSAQNPKFHLAITTTRREPGQNWMGYMGRIDAAMIQMMAPDYKERTVYVCGPNPFMEAVKATLESIGFPMENYYEESFGGPKKSKPPAAVAQAPVAPPAPVVNPVGGLMGMMGQMPAQAPVAASPAAAVSSPAAPVAPISAPASVGGQTVIVFSKTGKEVACDGEESILDIAEQNDVKIRSSCRSGTCGTCKKRKLEGEVNVQGDPDGLEDEDKQEGFILTCISFPVGRVTVDA